MSGGGSKGSTTQVVQNYSPEEVARRVQIQDEARRLYESTRDAYSQYPGARPIDPSAYTLLGEEYLKGLAHAQYDTALGLKDALKFGLKDALYAHSNPYLESHINAAIRPITQSFTDPDGVMAQIRNSAMDAGQYGGSRQGIAEGIAAGRYAQAIGDVTSKLASEGYSRGLDTFSRTMGLAPAVMQSWYYPANTLGMVGASEEGRAAELEDYLANKRAWELNAPWIPLQNYANMIYGGGSSGGSVSARGPGMTAGQRLIGGAAGGLAGYTLGSSAAGAALGNALGVGSLAGPLGVLGALIGAGLF